MFRRPDDIPTLAYYSTVEQRCTVSCMRGIPSLFARENEQKCANSPFSIKVSYFCSSTVVRQGTCHSRLTFFLRLFVTGELPPSEHTLAKVCDGFDETTIQTQLSGCIHQP